MCSEGAKKKQVIPPIKRHTAEVTSGIASLSSMNSPKTRFPSIAPNLPTIIINPIAVARDFVGNNSADKISNAFQAGILKPAKRQDIIMTEVPFFII